MALRLLLPKVDNECTIAASQAAAALSSDGSAGEAAGTVDPGVEGHLRQTQIPAGTAYEVREQPTTETWQTGVGPVHVTRTVLAPKCTTPHRPAGADEKPQRFRERTGRRSRGGRGRGQRREDGSQREDDAGMGSEE